MACEHHLAVAPGESALSVRKLSFAYGSKTVLHDVSMDVQAGRVTGLFGPNGSGKTTLFKCCLNFVRADSGSIELLGQPLASYSPGHLAQHIAYVPQEHQLIFPFTVREVVEMGRNPHRGLRPFARRGDREVVDHALARTGLVALAERVYGTLSGGQRQLVLLARALAQSASLIFLDEPTSSLDFRNQILVWETLLPIAADGVGIFICCHDPNHVLWFCDEAVIMKEGRVLAAGRAGAIVDQTLLRSLYGEDISMATVGGQPFIYFPRQNGTKPAVV